MIGQGRQRVEGARGGGQGCGAAPRRILKRRLAGAGGPGQRPLRSAVLRCATLCCLPACSSAGAGAGGRGCCLQHLSVAVCAVLVMVQQIGHTAEGKNQSQRLESIWNAQAIAVKSCGGAAGQTCCRREGKGAQRGMAGRECSGLGESGYVGGACSCMNSSGKTGVRATLSRTHPPTAMHTPHPGPRQHHTSVPGGRT